MKNKKFHRVDTTGNIFVSGAATSENITDPRQQDMKIGIFTGGTGVRSKNNFTAISRYPAGRHEIISSSSQPKDTNSTLFVTYPWPLPLRHFIGCDQNPSRPFKPSVTRNLPQNKKQNWRRPSKTKVVMFVTKFAKKE